MSSIAQWIELSGVEDEQRARQMLLCISAGHESFIRTREFLIALEKLLSIYAVGVQVSWSMLDNDSIREDIRVIEQLLSCVKKEYGEQINSSLPPDLCKKFDCARLLCLDYNTRYIPLGKQYVDTLLLIHFVLFTRHYYQIDKSPNRQKDFITLINSSEIQGKMDAAAIETQGDFDREYDIWLENQKDKVKDKLTLLKYRGERNKIAPKGKLPSKLVEKRRVSPKKKALLPLNHALK